MAKFLGLKIGILLLSMIMLNGCLAQMKYKGDEQKVILPQKWQAPGDVASFSPTENWLGDFADPHLDRMVKKAITQNYDLHLTALQLEKIQVSSSLTKASLWPSLQADITGRRGETRFSENGRDGTISAKKVGIGLSAAWELDVWGRLSDSVSASKNDIQAAESDYQAARISLVGQVAKIWFRIVAESLQLQLLERTLESYRLATFLIRSRYQSGIADPLDLRLARSNLATTEDLFYSRKNRLEFAKRDLQRLLNEYPDGRMDVPDQLPPLPTQLRAGIPSLLLENRPDIQAARNRLLAARLRVTVAQKEFLPKFSLTGEMGTSSKTLRNILDVDHSFWNIVGGITQPIFQGGRLQANLDLANISAEQALTLYGKILYQALYEVEQALSTGFYLVGRVTALRNSEKEAMAAELLAVEEYGAGLVDIITVLEAQRRLFNARSDLIDIQYLQLLNRVEVYVALGGRFERSLEL